MTIKVIMIKSMVVISKGILKVTMEMATKLVVKILKVIMAMMQARM